MQFLNPWALLALASLSIPIILHLWKQKPTRRLVIGSIKLLKLADTKQSQNLKIFNWLLLFLRMLMLALLVFVLAAAYLNTIPQKNEKKYILIPKGQLHLYDQQYKQKIDSLILKGFKLKDLSFNDIDLKSATAESTQTENSILLSEQLKALNSFIPAGSEVYLFKAKTLNSLGARLPDLSYKLKWLSAADSLTESHWSINYHHQVLKAQSQAGYTQYSSESAQPTAALRILIYADNIRELQYFQAAIQSIAEFSQRKIELTQDPTAYSQFDLGIWFSQKNIDTNFLSRLKKPQQIISLSNAQHIDKQSILREFPKVNIYKIIPSKNDYIPLIQDAYGQTFLSLEAKPDLVHYHFYSRLLPDWNNLAWGAEFVNLLYPMVFPYPKDAEVAGFEHNPKDLRQLASDFQIAAEAETSQNRPLQAKNTDLSPWLWSIAFIVFAIERVLTFYQRRAKHGA